MNATLAGFTESEFRSFALTLLVPALGYATLFMLNVPLSKLPGVSIEHKYRVPWWLLPFVTLALMFAVGFLATAYLTLHFHTVAPDRAAFEKNYHDQIDLAEKLEMPPVAQGDSLTLHIDKFERLSDLRVYVNNISVFGTHYGCIFRDKCNIPLPPIDLSAQLRLDTNRIDIHLENSGVNLCYMIGELQLSRDGRVIFRHRVEINRHGTSVFRVTNPDNPSYAVCGRLSRLVSRSAS